jgi:serine phosphatase RsbU (regulator of sigma subunit)
MEKYKIMVVDDSKFITAVLSSILKKAGYEVKVFYEAKSAISEVDSFKPHLILSDYMMPDVSGLEFCKIIKKNNSTNHIKFILITSLDDVDSKVDCFNVGADDYITKPFNNKEILARVKTHLSIKRLQDDLSKALDKIEKELEVVGKIQQNLLPSDNPCFNNLIFDSYYNTYSKSGGDYFDFIKIDENRIGILIGDVSGHGTSSTVIMTMLKILITKLLNNLKDPAEVLNRLNDLILEMLNIDKFATIFYGIIDINSLDLIYSNAAHPEPIVVNKITKTLSKLSGKKGLPVGILPFATGSYVNTTISFQKGDRVFLYTDGITENKDENSNLYDEYRFVDIIMQTINLELTEAKNKIIENVLDFSNNTFHDDITLVMFDVI